MKKTLISLLGISAALSTHAFTVDFSASEGFTSANIAGQNGWSRIYGPNPTDFTVDATAGTLDLAYTANGAIQRTFTDLEVGSAFDDTSSIVTYEITVDTIVKDSFTNGLSFGISGAGADNDITVKFRGDGYLQINDGILSGNDRILGGFDDLADGTIVSVVLDYGNDTYSVTRSDSGASFTNNSFTPGAQNPYYLRIDTGGALDISFDSISINAIPESSSYALISGFLALGWIMVRRRS